MEEWLSKPIGKSRDVILKEAFKLFLQRNVEKVTVPDLEQSTKLRRGAIFYHFKDKEAIFIEVVEKYFFSSLNIFYPLSLDKVCSLEDYWKRKKEHLDQILVWFKEEELLLNPYLAFFHLAEQANLYIPTFSERMLLLIDSDKQNWKKVAQSDYLVREKKMNSDVIGNMYRSIYIEQCHTACYNKGRFPCSSPSGILRF